MDPHHRQWSRFTVFLRCSTRPKWLLSSLGWLGAAVWARSHPLMRYQAQPQELLLSSSFLGSFLRQHPSLGENSAIVIYDAKKFCSRLNSLGQDSSYRCILACICTVIGADDFSYANTSFVSVVRSSYRSTIRHMAMFCRYLKSDERQIRWTLGGCRPWCGLLSWNWLWWLFIWRRFPQCIRPIKLIQYTIPRITIPYADPSTPSSRFRTDSTIFDRQTSTVHSCMQLFMPRTKIQHCNWYARIFCCKEIRTRR